MLNITTNHAITYTNLGKSIAQVCLKSTSALSDHFSKQASGVAACPERDTYIHTCIHTYTLLMLPKWAFQLNRIKNTNLYKLIKNVSTIIL